MTNDLISANEYGFGNPEVQQQNDHSLVAVEQSRAVAEVQASFVIAKRFPRDENQCFNKIIKACERPFLAEQAMYVYPKGGTTITGPSIRLAEVLAQSWGNIDCGVREISQGNGISVAEAYAIDLETNARSTKIFHVPHEIHTKKGKKKLTDPRDIYELVANQGARRMRACILAIIPGDIVDAAVDKCKHTLTHGKEPIADRIRKMVLALDEQGVKIEQIEKRLGHKLDAIVEQELIVLRGIYKSLKDGMAKREDFFDMGNSSATTTAVNELIANKKVDNNSEKVDKVTGEIKIEYPNDAKKIMTKLMNAKSHDDLDVAADLISGCDPDKQSELLDLYNKKKSDLK